MVVQSWNDRREAEIRAYNHMTDAAKQIERSVVQLFATNRSLASALGEVVRRQKNSKRSCSLACNEDLLALRRIYSELVPGIELLLLDAEGRAVAETHPELVGRIVGLPDITKLFATRGGVQAEVRFTKDLHNNPALLIARALRAPSGDLEATAILLEPLSVLDAPFDVPQLGPGRSITLLDGMQTLLIRKPTPISVNAGQRLPEIDLSRAGIGPGSFYATSPIDGIDRLVVRRELPYALTTGGMTLLVGMAKEDYLDAWVHSTQINATISLILLATWLWWLSAVRRGKKVRAQLQATANITRKVLLELPIPVAVISKEDHRVIRSNTAMVEMFGALAGEEQPLNRLFQSNETLGKFLAGDHPTEVAELVSRQGVIHAELHRTDVGILDGNFDPCWLLAFVDASDRLRREQRLKREATTDPLTGLANRRHFADEAEQAVLRARAGHPLSVLALDLDHFKQVNDTHGHDIGDMVLAMAARTFRNSLRDGDVAARMGGEEFAALLVDTTPERTREVAERIRQTIAATPVMLPNGTAVSVTISIGTAQWNIQDTDIQDALKRADDALYRAKTEGRNRVVSETATYPPTR